MEYIPIVLLAVLFVLAGKVRSFRVEVDFKEGDGGTPVLPAEKADRSSLPTGKDVQLLPQGDRRGGRRRSRRR
jgi:hypothetical protein